jgi:hypothetical protein
VKETEIQRAILDYLIARGIFAWRNNTGGMEVQGRHRRRFVRFGTPGAIDIIGVLPDGRFLAVEVKTPQGRVTDLQDTFLDSVRRNNGVAFVARSVDEAMERIGGELE